jgi:hypothetical protein
MSWYSLRIWLKLSNIDPGRHEIVFNEPQSPLLENTRPQNSQNIAVCHTYGSYGRVGMQTTNRASKLSRRNFLKLSAAALTAYALSSLNQRVFVDASTERPFLIGLNYPWIAYGHDYGKSGWGHDGIISGGWTCQTYTSSQGFTDSRYSVEKAHTGNGSLCIMADLVGQHVNKAQGEVYIDLNNHAPRGVSVPVNLENTAVSCWLCLPEGSAGHSHASNGVQLFFKSKEENNDAWYSCYSRWKNIESSSTGKWYEYTANPSDPDNIKDSQFDPKKIIAVGVKVAINSSSSATLQGKIYLDDFQLNNSPPVLFDFEFLEVERDFTEFACLAQVVRVFVFADGRAAPEFVAGGGIAAAPFDDCFFEDFDKLLEIAERHNLKIMPVLLDFSWCDTAEFINGVQLGGHADVIRDMAKRQTFLEYALKPLLERYEESEAIYAWDVMNEPEGAMDILGGRWVGDPVTVEQMQAFVRLCTEMIHAHSAHDVTVGSAQRSWLHYWQGLGLDLYQFHWYDHHAPGDPFPWPPYSELGLDKPCIIGEVPTDSTQQSTEEFIEAARNAGYHGLLPWSYRANDDFSDFADARPYLVNRCHYLPIITR